MKWFKHDTNAHRNRKLRNVIRAHGFLGYGFWSVLLEKLYEAEDNFSIHADDGWLQDIADEFKVTDYRTISRILDTFAESNLISRQLWEGEQIIFIDAIAERGDKYIEQRLKDRERKQNERILSVSERTNLESEETPVVSGKIRSPDTDTDTDSEADPKTETDPQKEKESSAVSNVVPIPKEPYQDFADIYNRFRPPTWVGVRSIGSDRKKITKAWIKSHGREGALERLENALRWLTTPSMQWWITKPGKFSYTTLGSKDRLYEWSECWGQLQSGENVIAMPEAQVEAAAAMASGHMANAEWIARKNRELGIANA